MGIADHFKANKVQAQCKAVSEDICKVSLISPRKVSKVNRACATALLQELVPQRKNLKRQVSLAHFPQLTSFQVYTQRAHCYADPVVGAA